MTGLALPLLLAWKASTALRRVCIWRTAEHSAFRCSDCLPNSEHVILVDAVRAKGPPGTLLRLDGEDVSDAVRDRLSPHQVGVADLLDAARLIDRYPATVTLLGLVPDTIDLAVARSTAIDDGLGELVAAIVQEVQSHGYEMVREPEAVGRPRPIRDLNRHFGM